MAKMTKEELERRKAATVLRARAEVAKSEIMQFRLDEANIVKLREHAAKCRIPVGAMVRQWVLERLTTEETHASSAHSENETQEQLSKLLDGQKQILSLLTSTTASQAPAPAPRAIFDLIQPSGVVVSPLADLEHLKDLKDNAR